MCPFNNILTVIALLWGGSIASASACTTPLRGYVKEANSQEPLAFVTVVVPQTGQVAYSDSLGYFEVLLACEGTQELTFSYVGYSDYNWKVTLPVDSVPILELQPSSILIKKVTVTAVQAPKESYRPAGLDEQAIGDRASSNLGNLLENLAGVSTLKNGSTIAKPIVQGLYGNRLTLLNNGIAQSGQQWGNDHSPEIDPLVSSNIQLLQGVGSLEYMGANTGTVVLLSPKAIGKAEDWHFRGRYFLESNGWTNGLHLAAQGATPLLSWRVNGTYQRGGDKHTPDYWLTNTGQQTASGSLQLERRWSPQLSSTLYASSFYTELGVLRGTHIGNLTDLNAAFQREIPFYTQPDFSYKIQAPKQRVQHHLIKLQTEHQVQAHHKLSYTLSTQLNDRREFDVRRGNRTKRPTLSLQQWTYFAEARHDYQPSPSKQLSTGLQLNFTDNTNRPETGVSPLIPDYTHARVGAFASMARVWKRSRLEAGLRYDFHNQHVATISTSFPREVVRYHNLFHAINAAASWSYALSSKLDMSLQAGYSTRNPGINELYSAGLHQGVSGIEEGDPDLNMERLAQGRLGLMGRLFKGLAVQGTAYYQYFDNYIYLQPQAEMRLTIRGAFPVFVYEQTRAHIYGADLGFDWDMNPYWTVGSRCSYLRGADLAQKRALINMPPNNWQSYLAYHLESQWKINRHNTLEDLELRLQHRYVDELRYLSAVQDFLPPPPAYHLLGFTAAATIQSEQLQTRFVLRVDNLLNTRYRDYLNRHRYFADAQGINVVLTASVSLAPPKAS
jgi:iron complex outermembrane receptor protein